MRKCFITTALIGLLTITGSVSGQGDPSVIADIIEEGRNNSQVWDYLLHLSENGPRLTGSSRLEAMNKWAMEEFNRMGLSNAHLFEWGTIPVRFDRYNDESYARIVEPIELELEFTWPSWSAGTNGPVKGRVFKLPTSIENLESIEEDLEGAWILTQGRQRGRRQGVTPAGMAPEIAEEINTRLEEAGIAGRIIANRDERVRTFSNRGWRELDPENLPDETTMYVRRSDYDTMNSRLADGEEIILDANLASKFVPGPIPVYNTIAEIPGTEWPEEVVIISAHLDSWDGIGSQGTQDNGTGSSVTIEAARILSTVGVEPKRTIRFILWTGEEQGLLGARAYVDSLTEEERNNISACFVDDGGTNYQGGLQCVEEMAPMLREATAPVNFAFPDMPVDINVQRRMPRGGGSDHAAFNAVGIPGFFWDEVGKGGREGKNYRFVWHTQNDRPRYAVPEYLVQSATCSAITAYNLAMADTLLPRAPEIVAEGDDEDEPITPSVRAREAVALLGTWNAARFSEDEADKTPFQIIFREDDGRLSGTLISERGESEITNIQYQTDSSRTTFELRLDYGTIEYAATLAGDTMSGTLAMSDMFERKFEATRAASPEEEGAEDAAAEPADEPAGDDAEWVTADGAVSGQWQGEIDSEEIPDSEGFTLTFEMSDDGRVRGTLASPQVGEGPIKDATFDPETNTLTFTYDVPDMGALEFEAKVDGDSMQGTLGIPEMFSVPFRATRND